MTKAFAIAGLLFGTLAITAFRVAPQARAGETALAPEAVKPLEQVAKTLAKAGRASELDEVLELAQRDRATFDAVQTKIKSRRVMPRGHVHQFLLTGLVYCANCGDAITGTTRTRKKIVGGETHTYSQPLYICGGSLRTKGCRQIGLPRDGFERAVLRVLDEEVFNPEARARLERALREEVSRRSTADESDGVVALEKREVELSKQIAEAARRLLIVDESVVRDVNAALTELKGEQGRVHSAIKEKQRAAAVTRDGEQTIQETMNEFRSMERVLRNPSLPLERRREVLRNLLPRRDGTRPICVHFDPKAAKGWRRALRRVTVRHLSTRAPEQARERAPEMSPFVVAGAVAAEAEQPVAPGWDLAEGLAAWERELGIGELEAEPALVGAVETSWG